MQSSLEGATLRLASTVTQQHSATPQGIDSVSASPRATPSVLTLTPGFMKKTGLDTRRLDSVMALNDAYAFEITKNPQSDQYAIRWLERLGGWSMVQRVVETQRANALAEALGYWYLFGVPFFELATNTSCRVTVVSAETNANREFLRVEFQTEREGWTPSQCFALLDPEQGFVPVESGGVYQVNRDHPEWTGEYVASIELGEPIEGLPIVKRKTENWKSKDWLRDGPEIVQTRTTTIEVLPVADVSPEEFYLSHFGLPEPYFGRRWLRSLWVYVLGGAACLAMAYAIRRRRRLAAA
ncbi:MAG: hypothetical protein AB7I48_20620 [Planctomycetaceae bacterium]